MSNRYSRQTILGHIGPKGQQQLLAANVVVIGCGALGTNVANHLTRAGIGTIRLVDRDLVELNNLQRQTLFDETDVGKPKVLAAAEKLRKTNSEITIETTVKDLNSRNIEELVQGADIVLDATDNIPTRMLINDACVKHDIPWIYTGAIQDKGMMMTIMPDGPCFRCLMPELPPTGALPTCELAGVLNTIPAIMASIQCTEAYKILMKKEAAVDRRLLNYDVWEHRFQAIELEKDPDCACCGKKEFTYLESPVKEIITHLCENSIQIIPRRDTVLDLMQIAKKLEKSATNIMATDFLLKFEADNKKVSLFKDGRALIKGTGDKGAAKAFYSRYLAL